jgi:hypothetical protein
MPNTSQHSPNVTGKAAKCFAGKLAYLTRIQGIRAIVVKKPIRKNRDKKPTRAQRKIWKIEGEVRNNTQHVTWHNVQIEQEFIIIF